MWPPLEDMFLKEKFPISDEENDSDTGPEVSDVRIVYPDEVSDEDECDVFHIYCGKESESYHAAFSSYSTKYGSMVSWLMI